MVEVVVLRILGVRFTVCRCVDGGVGGAVILLPGLCGMDRLSLLLCLPIKEDAPLLLVVPLPTLSPPPPPLVATDPVEPLLLCAPSTLLLLLLFCCCDKCTGKAPLLSETRTILSLVLSELMDGLRISSTAVVILDIIPRLCCFDGVELAPGDNLLLPPRTILLLLAVE